MDLIYPKLCHACLEERIFESNNIFCVKCHAALPYTDHFIRSENEMMNHFYGRVKVERAAALLYFREGGLVQQILHHFKYKGMQAIGEQLGRVAAEKMVETGFYRDIDCIVPVPMYSAKKRQRGFNQSEVLAKAISAGTNIPMEEGRLLKVKKTTSQTQKGRLERLENIQGSFIAPSSTDKRHSHVLLVDDVTTTGATLEACTAVLHQSGIEKVSIFSLAIAE
ncbi:MAG: ComF family protein [Saprospiraceae bacterium]|nr:ComF family protein [Saprospiraceae bacterium]